MKMIKKINNFLIYLNLNNLNDFSRVEGIVWDKLIEKDYGWIPIDNEDDGDEGGFLNFDQMQLG